MWRPRQARCVWGLHARASQHRRCARLTALRVPPPLLSPRSQNITEGIFEQTLKTMKVPGIKRIGFKQLTFGNAPFAVESIYVSDKHQVRGRSPPRHSS